MGELQRFQDSVEGSELRAWLLCRNQKPLRRCWKVPCFLSGAQLVQPRQQGPGVGWGGVTTCQGCRDPQRCLRSPHTSPTADSSTASPPTWARAHLPGSAEPSSSTSGGPPPPPATLPRPLPRGWPLAPAHCAGCSVLPCVSPSEHLGPSSHLRTAPEFANKSQAKRPGALRVTSEPRGSVGPQLQARPSTPALGSEFSAEVAAASRSTSAPDPSDLCLACPSLAPRGPASLDPFGRAHPCAMYIKSLRLSFLRCHPHGAEPLSSPDAQIWGWTKSSVVFFHRMALVVLSCL